MKKERNWEEIQKFYDNNHTWRDVSEKFDININTLYYFSKKGIFKSRTKSEASKLSRKLKPQKHSEETKKKISEARIKFLRENPDKVPYKLNHYSKGESYPEKYFNEILKKHNLNYERYYKISVYELDFAFLNKGIDLEIDGDQHYLDKSIIESDKRRNKYLSKNGWTIIRIKWSDYQKLNHKQKINYIDNLIKFIIDKQKLPKIPKINDNNICKCGNKKSKNAIMCRNCRNEYNRNNKDNYIIKNNTNSTNLCKCGNIKNKYAKQCKECSIKKQQRFEVSKEELKKLLENNSYVAIGKMFSVSDNAIRKRAKKYNLI